MDHINLSKRLACVASFVPNGARLADIGSDHAYLPAYLLLNKKIKFAIAGEIAQGPLQNVKNEIKKSKLTNTLEARLGNGLEVIKTNDKIDTVVIAGMGGQLIKKILEQTYYNNNKYQNLILQPNTDVYVVRNWLQQNEYKLINESIILEDGHYYEVLIAKPGYTEFTTQQLTFGPFNLQRKEDIWIQKWQIELNRLNKLIEILINKQQTDSIAYHNYKNKIREIREIL